MSLDLGILENNKVLPYNENLMRFKRIVKESNDGEQVINYQFGFPAIDASRFGILRIYNARDRRYIPDIVINYFSSINEEQHIAYLYKFYPNGEPNGRNRRLISSREGKKVGTDAFNLIKSDLVKLDIKNLFVTPLTSAMEKFLGKKGFSDIGMVNYRGLPLGISFYGIVLG